MMMASDITEEVYDREFLNSAVSFIYHFGWILLEECKNIYFSIQLCVSFEISAKACLFFDTWVFSS
jgi:hypothetical protein